MDEFRGFGAGMVPPPDAVHTRLPGLDAVALMGATLGGPPPLVLGLFDPYPSVLPSFAAAPPFAVAAPTPPPRPPEVVVDDVGPPAVYVPPAAYVPPDVPAFEPPPPAAPKPPPPKQPKKAAKKKPAQPKPAPAPGPSPGPGPGGGAGASNHTGAVLATYDARLNVAIRAGTGAGGGKSFGKSYGGRPFPAANALVVSFDIFFAPGFEWGCRGKVGGLYVGTGSASGCNYSTNGASHRLMWEGDGTPFAYVYIPQGTAGRQPRELASPSSCGQGVFKKDFARMFTTGKWFHVELGIKLNAPGAADGQLMLSVDGKSRTLGGVVWRTSNLPITSFRFNVFHGGPCKATKNSAMQLANVKAHAWKD